MHTQYYDLITIRGIHERCQYSEASLTKGYPMQDEDGTVIDEWPPMSLVDIARLQVLLYNSVRELSCGQQLAGSLAIDWIGNLGKHAERIVQLDLKQEDCDEDKVNTAYKLVDAYFNHIRLTYTACHLGYLSVPPETALYAVPKRLQYASIQIPLSYGAFVVTSVASSAEENDETTDNSFVSEILEDIKSYLGDF